MIPTRQTVQAILSGPLSIIDSAALAVSATDDPNLAAALIRAAIADIDRALDDIDPLVRQTTYLHDATEALQSAQRTLTAPWHPRTDSDDNPSNRAYVARTGRDRLIDARGRLSAFLGE